MSQSNQAPPSQFEAEILDNFTEQLKKKIEMQQEQLQQSKAVYQVLQSIKNRGRWGTYPRQPKSKAV